MADLDLAGEVPAPPPPLVAPDGGKKLIDMTRVGLAAGLTTLLALLVIITALFVAIRPTKEPAIESYLKIVFAPLIGLVGSVVGFYFGANTVQKNG